MNSKTLITRFAPSPTGFMHFGNIRTALFNYLYAKKHGGSFLLRIEDTDRARSTVEYEQKIIADLEQLGLKSDLGPYRQSERASIYAEYYALLEQKGLAYPCFCSEEQLLLQRKMQLQQKLPPRYSGTCYKLSPEEVAAKKAANIPYTLRFRVRKGEVVFKDLIKGEQKFNAEHIGDFIIRRQDNTASFMFCNAIDDALMQVTHALRGEDHVTNTPRQLLILEALGLQAPQYGHFPIILGQDGAPLSKRNGSKSLDDVNKEGYAILAVNNYLARLGQHLDDNTVYALSELAQCFTLEKINHAPAHYDAMQLAYWQKEVMHRMPADDLVAQLKPYLTAIPAAKQMQFVKLVQPNLCFPQEVAAWVEIFSSNWQLPAYLQEKLVADKLVFKAAIDFLKQQGLLDNLLAEVKAISGLSGKKLFLPLRLALTSREDGPELNKIFNYLGHDLIIKRLEAVC